MNMEQMPEELRSRKTAIVFDWMVNYAGADQVTEQLHRMFPDAPIYTLIYDRKHYPDRFREYDIRTTWMQHIPFAPKLYKNLLTLMPGAFEQLDLSEFDLVISVSTCCAKGVITGENALHICYCNTPARYAWSMWNEYLAHAGKLKKLYMISAMRRFRVWDCVSSQRVDAFIGNSTAVAKRIRKFYRRDSEVIYPPVVLDAGPLSQHTEDFYLMVGRLVRYKRFDLGIEACKRLNRRLIIVGTGEEMKKLRSIAGPETEFVGRLPDAEVRELYRHARAFLFPGEDDFGMTPVEAQSAGCPVIAYGQGGALDTVKDGETGLLFREQTVDALCDGILRFEQICDTLDRQRIHEHAEQFGEAVFRERMTDYLLEKVRQQFPNS